MSRILLLVSHRENLNLLANWLTQQNFEILYYDPSVGFDADCDLMIVDGVLFDRHWKELQSKKLSVQPPVFLPMLLITSRQDVNMLTRQLWQTIDDIIFHPIEKAELLVRLEILLRTRQFSAELTVANTQLRQEIITRHEAEAKLQESLQQKMQSLAIISHELHSPLSLIKSFIDSLLQHTPALNRDQQSRVLKIIGDGADRMTYLVEQLFEYSKIEAGVLRILPGMTKVGSIIQTALPELELLTADHQLEVHVAPDLPPVMVDTQRIIQVLVNLIGNSARYSPAQTVISLSVKLAGDFIQVDVSDQGMGIPEDKREKVFEAFYQLNDRSSSQKGAGLGLAISKSLITAQGGDMWIQDQNPPGTTISFAIPLTGSPQQPQA